MPDWHAMFREQTAGLDLVCKYAEVVIKDPALTLEQAETLLAQVTKGRVALGTFIFNVKRAKVIDLFEPARKLDGVWSALQQAAAARLEIIQKLEIAPPEGMA